MKARSSQVPVKAQLMPSDKLEELSMLVRAAKRTHKRSQPRRKSLQVYSLGIASRHKTTSGASGSTARQTLKTLPQGTPESPVPIKLTSRRGRNTSSSVMSSAPCSRRDTRDLQLMTKTS